LREGDSAAMQTKLSVFCDKLIEAGWLAAVIIAPLFFNFYGHRAFELNKVTLIRSIALMMALAWIVRSIEGGLSKASVGLRRIASGNPLAIPALILAGVYILATITSVVPRTSLWGAFGRPQGTYTTLCYIVIFFLIWHSLRTRQQLERLIFALLLTSLPVSLYGIMQQVNLDPLPSAADDLAGRLKSTMGNPIFLSAYLILVVPVTLERLLDSLSVLLRGEGKRIYTCILAGCYALLLAAQLLCILFAQSRGPVLGLMGGMFFFLLLFAIYEHRRSLVLAVNGVAIVLLLTLILVNLPHSPLAFLRDVPYLGRFAYLVPEKEFPGRMLIWQGAIDMATADPWRALVGYGPDSLFVAYNKFYPAELVQYELGERPDRLHNQTFDALVTTGLIGLAAYILLFASVFYYGLKALGLSRNRKQRVIFVTLWLLGGSLGVLISRLLEGTWRLAGVGLPLGFVVALAVYLTAQALLFNCASQKPESSWRRRLLIALLSAIIAHFIEIQSGITVAATLTYFWTYAALLVIAGYPLQEESHQVMVAASPSGTSSRRRGRERRRRRRPRRPSAKPWDSAMVSCSLLMGVILMTMGFDFITRQFKLTSGGVGVLGLMLVVWLFGGIIIVAQISGKTLSSQSNHSWGSSFVAYGLISLGGFLMFLVSHVTTISPGHDIANTIVVYYLFLFLAMAAVGISLMKDTATRLRFWRRNTWWLYPILCLVVAVLIFTTNLAVVRADVYFRMGLALRQAERYDESIALYRRALALDPHQDRYYLFIGLDSMAKMETASDMEHKSYWFEESKKAFEEAWRISPLDPDHPANLGTLYLRWAWMTSEPVERVKRLERALEYYQQAVALSPNHHGLRLKSDILEIHLLLGNLYIAMGELDRAMVIYEKASEVDPDDHRSHQGLAIVYQRLGRLDDALTEAERAKDLAPLKEKEQLDELILKLEVQKP